MKNQDKAEQLFRNALKSDSNSETLELLSQALALNSENPNILALRAVKMLIAGKSVEAKEDYLKSIEIDPENIFALEAKALFALSEGNYSEAILVLDDFLVKVISIIQDWQKNAIKIFKLRISSSQKYFNGNDVAQALYWKAVALDKMGELETALECLNASSNHVRNEGLNDQIAQMRHSVIRKKEEILRRKKEAEAKRKSKYMFRVLDSLFLSPHIWFWAISFFCLYSSVVCIINEQTLTGYKLLGLGILISPVVSIAFSYLLKKPFGRRSEEYAYAFSLALFCSLSIIAIPKTFWEVPSGNSPSLPSISSGTDFDSAMDEMREFQSQNGGDISCPNSEDAFTCVYTAPGGEKRVLYFQTEIGDETTVIYAD